MDSLDLQIDKRYISGRDNYKCQSCGKPELALSETKFRRIDLQKEWLNSNTRLVCPACEKDNLSPLPNTLDRFHGRLIVITGPMYSEKSTTTRSYFNKYKVALNSVLWIKPDTDSRADGYSQTRNGELIQAFTVSARRPDTALPTLIKYQMVAIDEVQFFSDRILYVIHRLLEAGKIVIVNGLKLKANRSFFGALHYLLAEADEIINLTSVCSVCQDIDSGTRTKSLNGNLPSELVGGPEQYYAVCPRCDGGHGEDEFIKSFVQSKKAV